MVNLTIESEIISCENVKPSSPTPSHLQTYKLSMIDQIQPSIPLPVLFYFANKTTTTTSDEHIDEMLKNSLSLTMTEFYPVAGTASEDLQSVDCNDEGVPFTVARIKGHKLSDFLKNHPGPEFTGQLLPCEVTIDVEWDPGCNVAMIQVTHFDCGGVAVGAVFWHKVFDAVTLSKFIKHWAATSARGGDEPLLGPNYSLQSIFPQKEELRTKSLSVKAYLRGGKSMTRRYVFDESAIRRLKNRAEEESSRFEVITALIWKAFIVASVANDKPASAIIYSADFRRRARPPLASECFGNCATFVAASRANNIDDHEEKDEDLLFRHLVKEIRNATSGIDGECAKQGLPRLSPLGKIPAGADPLSFTSWCSMGFYDVDFGWGKPIWLMARFDGPESSSPIPNSVWLIDTKLGGPVEVWVTLDEKHMKPFENVEELKSYALVDPSPLDFADSYF